MSSAFIHSKRPIMLVAGAGASRPRPQNQDEADSAFNWQVDETVVAFTRAAIAGGIPLAVPMDAHYAPLVAHVASEYLSPEMAEGRSQNMFDGEQGDGLRAISFVSLGKPSGQARRRAAPAWTEVFRTLKVVSEDVRPLREFMENTEPLGAVGIGQGRTVNALFREAMSMQMPRFRLTVRSSHGTRLSSVAEPIADEIERRLVGLRKELIIMSVRGRSRLRDERDEFLPPAAPPSFHAYPPLALYAQMLVDMLAADGSDTVARR